MRDPVSCPYKQWGKINRDVYCRLYICRKQSGRQKTLIWRMVSSNVRV